MRLTTEQQETIRNGVSTLFSSPVEVFLFGSRVDDSAKGGDIDLLIVLPEPVENHALTLGRVSARLSMLLGGRKVDVLLQYPGALQQPIHRVALQQGVKL
jgi:predicted nucleotidyltransferase